MDRSLYYFTAGYRQDQDYHWYADGGIPCAEPQLLQKAKLFIQQRIKKKSSQNSSLVGMLDFSYSLPVSQRAVFIFSLDEHLFLYVTGLERKVLDHTGRLIFAGILIQADEVFLRKISILAAKSWEAFVDICNNSFNDEQENRIIIFNKDLFYSVVNNCLPRLGSETYPIARVWNCEQTKDVVSNELHRLAIPVHETGLLVFLFSSEDISFFCKVNSWIATSSKVYDMTFVPNDKDSCSKKKSKIRSMAFISGWVIFLTILLTFSMVNRIDDF
ncbi:MAG: hypothetical protein ACP59X_04995 [Solidesulfovibrio sp. DCME]|uniref:hypothetical protein n=1 Tax=Solidesulfovibrio sp. DCME TaxID=3447380 RepID=UPI003D0AA6D0